MYTSDNKRFQLKFCHFARFFSVAHFSLPTPGCTRLVHGLQLVVRIRFFLPPRRPVAQDFLYRRGFFCRGIRKCAVRFFLRKWAGTALQACAGFFLGTAHALARAAFLTAVFCVGWEPQSSVCFFAAAHRLRGRRLLFSRGKLFCPPFKAMFLARARPRRVCPRPLFLRAIALPAPPIWRLPCYGNFSGTGWFAACF